VERFPGIEQEQVVDSSALMTGLKEHGARRATVFMMLGFGPTSWIALCKPTSMECFFG
jgi:hypothetical protein